MKIPRAEDRRSHRHDTRSWHWDPERAAWIGVCRSCGAVFEADGWTAMRLERYAEEAPANSTAA